MTVSIGCFDYGSGMGTESQLAIVASLGDDAIQITNPDYTYNADILFLDGGMDTTALEESDGRNTLIYNVGAGRVAIVNDEVGGFGFASATPGDTEQVNFVDDSGPLATGAGGTLTDLSLDNYGASNAGCADISDLENQEIAVLATTDDPTHALAVAELVGEGWLILSSVRSIEPTAAGDTGMTAFTTNELDYAAHLFGMTETVLSELTDGYTGTTADDEVFALGGDDNLKTIDGNDIVHAGLGDDKVVTGTGDDLAWGDDGNDLVKGGTGNDQLWGGSGFDKLNGGTGDDYLEGGSDVDRLKGAAGNDTLIGGSGHDLMNGGAGDDVIVAGADGDDMTGGAGNDRFIIGTSDLGFAASSESIDDFTHGQDIIDLTEFNHAFTFAPGGDFTHTAYEISLVDTGGQTTVSLDIDGDGMSDEAFTVQTATPLDATDFVF